MSIVTLKETIAREVGTPALVADLDVVERNIARLQARCDAAGIKNRPHIKTHKSVRLARMQVAAGAVGVTCQKLGEAEVMADAGIDDIFISYNLIGGDKIERLGKLLQRVNLSVAADNPVVVEALSNAGWIAGRNLPVLVECDTGRKRAGVETPAEAIALARQIALTQGLSFEGLMFYAPENAVEATNRFYDEVKTVLDAEGIRIKRVSTGGSPNLINLGKMPAATEHRSGTSIFNDRMQMAAGVATEEECALTVYSTVVSRAGAERGILDAGSKVFTSDTGWKLDGYGHILEHPEARISQFAEEHGFLDLSRCNDRPRVGDVVRVIPNHVCVTVNVVGELVLVRGDRIDEVVRVEARGLLR